MSKHAGKRNHVAPVRERLATGAAFGGTFAAFGVLGLILILLATGEIEAEYRGGTLVRLDLGLLFFPVGALLSGVIFFTLVPVTRSRILAAIVGAVSFLPWAVSIALFLDNGHRAWTVLTRCRR